MIVGLFVEKTSCILSGESVFGERQKIIILFFIMSGGKVQPRRRLVKIIALPLFCMLAMLVVVISLNWKYLSSDFMSGMERNSFYRDDKLKPILSSVVSTFQSIPTSAPSFFLRTDKSDNAMVNAVKSQANVLQSMELGKLQKPVNVLDSQSSVGLPGSMNSVSGVNSVINVNSANNADDVNGMSDVSSADSSGEQNDDSFSMVNNAVSNSDVSMANNVNLDSAESVASNLNPASKMESISSVSSDSSSDRDEFDTVLDTMSQKLHASSSQALSGDESPSCEHTPLAESLSKSTLFHLSDFDCSSSNQGWEQSIPPPATNSTRAKRLWLKRRNLLLEFADQQNHFDLSDPNSKFIVFWPIFAGIGNNLAVFAEVMLIAMRSNRKFLVYDWSSLRNYFYLPFQFEVITEKGILSKGCSLFFSVGTRSRHIDCRENEPMSL